MNFFIDCWPGQLGHIPRTLPGRASGVQSLNPPDLEVSAFKRSYKWNFFIDCWPRTESVLLTLNSMVFHTSILYHWYIKQSMVHVTWMATTPLSLLVPEIHHWYSTDSHMESILWTYQIGMSEWVRQFKCLEYATTQFQVCHTHRHRDRVRIQAAKHYNYTTTWYWL